jgi:hypothetical protein
MPRWEAVATFALVAFVLSVLYQILAAFVISSLGDMAGVKHPDPALTVLGLLFAFWIAPALGLLRVAIAYDVWRHERLVTDALILTPICLLMPVVAIVTFAVVACSSDACLS